MLFHLTSKTQNHNLESWTTIILRRDLHKYQESTRRNIFFRAGNDQIETMCETGMAWHVNRVRHIKMRASKFFDRRCAEC